MKSDRRTERGQENINSPRLLLWSVGKDPSQRMSQFPWSCRIWKPRMRHTHTRTLAQTHTHTCLTWGCHLSLESWLVVPTRNDTRLFHPNQELGHSAWSFSSWLYIDHTTFERKQTEDRNKIAKIEDKIVWRSKHKNSKHGNPIRHLFLKFLTLEMGVMDYGDKSRHFQSMVHSNNLNCISHTHKHTTHRGRLK